MLEEKTKSPDFSLPDQFGKIHSFSSYKGKWVLLYFYPKDFTSGCTKEACSLRDSWDQFKKSGIVVLGISKDNIESHKKFSEKYSLPFILLSDVDKKVITKYGAWQKKKMYGREYFGTSRISYLINPAGEIVKVYPKVDPQSHPSEIINDYKTLNK